MIFKTRILKFTHKLSMAPGSALCPERKILGAPTFLLLLIAVKYEVQRWGDF